MKDLTSKTLGRPRSIKSHQSMLKATLELLGEVGFELMSIEAIAKRAKIGKTTIYRRYGSKEELVADAIESIREEVIIPDTGNLWEDIDKLIEEAARIVLNPLGKQAVAMIVSSASSNGHFARVYWEKYLQPRRRAFALVLENAKARDEIGTDIDSDLIFDAMSGMMLFATIFQPNSESWFIQVKKALHLLFAGAKSLDKNS